MNIQRISESQPTRRGKSTRFYAVLMGLPLALGGVLWMFKASIDRERKPRYTIIVPRTDTIGYSAGALAFSGEGRQLAIADTQTRLWKWNLATQKFAPSFRHRSGDGPESMAWKGDRLVVGDPYVATVFQSSTGKVQRQTLPTPNAPGQSQLDHYAQCVLSQNATLAALGQVHGAVALWDTKNGRRRWAIKAPNRETCGLAISPDDQSVAVASLLLETDQKEPRWDWKSVIGLEIALRDARTSKLKRTIRWDAARFDRVISFRGNLGNIGLAFSPDNTRLVASGIDGFALWNAKTGATLRTVRRNLRTRYGGRKWIAFSPDGKQIAEAGFGAKILVWSSQSGDLLQMFHSVYFSSALAYSPDGRFLATGGQERGRGVVHVWDVQNLG